MFTLKVGQGFEFTVDNAGVFFRVGKREMFWSRDTGLVRD